MCDESSIPKRAQFCWFYGRMENLESQDEMPKDIDRTEKWSKLLVTRKEHLIVKRYKLGSNEAITYVENMPQPTYNEIRWHTELYYPTQKIIIGGLTIKEPGQSYYEKFKAGELALPEPEKTIYESIRCVEPKKKKSKSAKAKK